MFIELAELLRCPADHPPTYLVLAPDEMEGRSVVRGELACPSCRRHFTIRDGTAFLGCETTSARSASKTKPGFTAPELAALLGLTNPGGYLLMGGSAAGIAAELAPLVSGVHLVGFNHSGPVGIADELSLLESDEVIPLRDSSMRGVALGRDLMEDVWLAEAIRVLLRGQRLVLDTELELPEGLELMARERGLTVGRKT